MHRETVAVVRRALLAGVAAEEIADLAVHTAGDAFTLLAGGMGRDPAKPRRPGR
ncbi:hypothetical protein [Phytohabitans kaempferiae]|uniref:Uncharacterized protein n=1 Tax=Phytohabitans kaempferiae TaxID=1620943 RepID=A0ABV6M5E4_9ACTN